VSGMAMNSYPATAAGQTAVQTRLDDASQQLAALRQELRQMHRLTVLGTAAAMIAHEFNNLMTPLIGYARFALDSGDPGLMEKALHTTLKQAAIVTPMCERILGLASDEASTFTEVNVREVVEESVACLCRDLSKDGIRLTVAVDDSLTVLADAKQLQQVLINLLLNAREAIGESSGRITIEAERAGPHMVALNVRDTGCGISPERMKRIFEPFVTSKGDACAAGTDDSGSDASGSRDLARRGVGLGLALCHDIIEEHGGTISIESEVNKGTTFTLTLPVAEG
jgi:two-component system NtrC family sensor kinase